MWESVSLDSGNGLIPLQCQAITWTDDDNIPLDFMPPPIHNELKMNFYALKNLFFFKDILSWCQKTAISSVDSSKIKV